jgi:hypothetical protein
MLVILYRSALEISMSENLQVKSNQLVPTDGGQSQMDQVTYLSPRLW